MKLADIKKIDRAKLPNEDFKNLYDEIKNGTGDFDEEFIELFDSEIKEFLTAVKKYVPEAITERVVKVRQPRKKVEKPIDFEDDDVVETVMEDYNLTKDKAVKLIALRKEAYELKKENIEKLLDRLDKSEFYQGRNYASKSPIDKGRTRDLGKDSKQGSITLAEERKMSGRPFKRISKEGRKNQYGTTEGGKVYYEYRMNRRDVDKKIKLETGGMTMIPSANVYMKSTADFSEEGKKRWGEYVIKAWNTGQTHGMIFTPNEKWNTILTNNQRLEDEGWKRIDWSEVPKEALMTFHDKLPFDMKTSFSPYYEPLPEMKLRIKEDGTIYKNGGGVDMFVSHAPDPNNWIPSNGKNKDFKIDLTFNDKATGKTTQTSYLVSAPNEKQAKENALWNLKRDFPLAEQISIVKTELYKNGGGVGIPNADKMFHLPYEIAVYVPSTKDVDKNITATELRARVKEVEKYLAETFGGFTSAEKVGGYLSSKSSVVTEKVIPVTAFATMQSFKDNKAKLVNKMSVWAKKWGQEAIGFEFEGDLYYVPQKFKTGGKLTATYIPKRDIKTLTTVWGNNIKGKDLIDGAYTLRTDIKRQPKMARTMFEDEIYEYGTGGLLQDPNDLYKLLNQAEINWKKDDGAEYKKIQMLIAKNNNLYYKQLNDAEKNYFQDKGAEYERLIKMKAKFKTGGTTKPKEPTIVRGFSDDEAYEYAKGGKPKMVRYYFEDEEYEYAKGGMTAHGLKRGDTIVDDMFWENKIVVKGKDGKRAMISLETGLRTEEK